MLTDRIERKLRDRLTRRSYLEGAGAVIGVWMIPGVTADRATADDGDESKLRKEPFAHVLSPNTLNQFSDRMGEPIVEFQEEMTAAYVDLAQIRDDVTGVRGEQIVADEYPQIMADIKSGDAEDEEPDIADVHPEITAIENGGAGDEDPDIAHDDVQEYVTGKCGDGLIRTTHDYDTLNGILQEQGFQQEDKWNGWTIFDGTGERGLPDRETKVALRDGDLAHVTAVDSEYTAFLNDLDEGIYKMVDLLSGEEWLSLRSSSDYAQYAEQLLHNEGDGQWDRVHLQTESVMARLADDRDSSKPVSVVTLTDYGGNKDEIRKKKLYDNRER